MIKEPKRVEYLQAVRNLLKNGVTDLIKFNADVKAYAIMYDMDIIQALAIAQSELNTYWRNQ